MQLGASLLDEYTLTHDGDATFRNSEAARTILVVVDADGRTFRDDNILVQDGASNDRIGPDPDPIEHDGVSDGRTRFDNTPRADHTSLEVTAGDERSE